MQQGRETDESRHAPDNGYFSGQFRCLPDALRQEALAKRLLVLLAKERSCTWVCLTSCSAVGNGRKSTVINYEVSISRCRSFRMVRVLTLKLVCERKIWDLMPGPQPTERWEASGVLAKGRHYFVVFDDRKEIARIADALQPNDTNGLFGMSYSDYGYEGITYNTTKQRFYLLVEARKHARDCYKASIVEYDDDFRYLKDRPVDFAFESSNKGFEAIVHVRRNGKDCVLALCEGNKCRGGNQGRKPGGGRVLLFEKKRKCWLHSRTISLPRSLPFVDFSGMSIDNGRVAIVSQVNSMLWVGQFDEPDWTCRNEGTALRVSTIREWFHSIR